MIQEIQNAFIERFGKEPFLVKSPGRVNLIGEHTDYNNGFVLPAAINKAIYFAVAPNDENLFRFVAIDLDESYITSTNEIGISEVHWANYLLGVIAQFVNDGKSIKGMDCVFGGDVPLGAGMSSSAAIECGMAFAINHLNKFEYSTLQLTQFAQKAEHEYAGVQCGIMDQFASMHGKANQVVKLDCRSLEYELFPLDMTEYLLVLVNTGVKHALASSEYNKRRHECESGVKILNHRFPTVNSLRDATLDMMNQLPHHFTPDEYLRCTYIIEENLWVEMACSALLAEDFKKFGTLMYQSHAGLRDKFQVSCSELDELVTIASEIKGVVGSRMMGGGFGGCTINLVQRNSVQLFEQTIRKRYKTPTGDEPEIFEVIIDNGTCLLN